MLKNIRDREKTQARMKKIWQRKILMFCKVVFKTTK